ncbi:MAG: PstS family phosphate ABC transporter substrate-binding protein [Marinilabiliaceae bacterium]|nr:PstS family phosphate ABC transporter substrate-binding protein [Marinilabiliaceae bacterium]
MKTIIISFFLVTICFLSACVSKKQKENTISISGAFALYPLVVKWGEEYKKEHPEIRFNISGGGAGKGMADALSGTVDLGMFSRSIAREEIDKGVWWVGLTIDAVIPTISDKNPYLLKIKEKGLTQDEFANIFIHETITYWDNLFNTNSKTKINIYTRSDACGAAGTWAKYLGGAQEDLKGIGVYGDPGLAEAASKDHTSIAYNNTIYVYDVVTGKKRPGIEVIPIDINKNGTIDAEENFYDSFETVLKAIADGIYPSPPARELYFVANEKPQKKATIDFIHWTLTKGQKYVKEAGYVPIDNAKINEYLQKVSE